jgi:hypothetical protein
MPGFVCVIFFSLVVSYPFRLSAFGEALVFIAICAARRRASTTGFLPGLYRRREAAAKRLRSLADLMTEAGSYADETRTIKTVKFLYFIVDSS